MVPTTVPTLSPCELDPADPIPLGSVLMDVRERDEWDAGHVPEALHIPLGELPGRVAEVPVDGRIMVVCHSGTRSARATAWLNEAGYDAVNVAGGMVDWQRAGLPVV